MANRERRANLPITIFRGIMKKIIFFIFFISLVYTQTQLSLNNPKKYYIFSKGMKLEFYNPGGTKPFGGFIVGDTLMYLIGSRAFTEAVYYKQKGVGVDSLNSLYELRIKNLLEIKSVMEKQITAEQKAFDEMKLISEKRDKIALEAIEKAESFRTKGILFSSFAGLVAGLLWNGDNDSDLLKIIKPLAMAGGGFFLSYTIFK